MTFYSPERVCTPYDYGITGDRLIFKCIPHGPQKDGEVHGVWVIKENLFVFQRKRSGFYGCSCQASLNTKRWNGRKRGPQGFIMAWIVFSDVELLLLD